MEVDQPVAPGPDLHGERFRQRVESAERYFLEFTGRQIFLQRANRPVLQQMCQNRGLDDTGTKRELYLRLVAWVNSATP